MIVSRAVAMENAGARNQHESMVRRRTVHKGKRHMDSKVGCLPPYAEGQRLAGFVLYLDQVPFLHIGQVIKDGGTADRIQVPKYLRSAPISRTMPARVPGHFIHAMR